jgi:uncharacterized protein (TIGR02147 family)
MVKGSTANRQHNSTFHSSTVVLRTHLAVSNSVREFLWREYELIKLKNSRYSLSSFAKRLKLSRSFMSDLLRGTRSLSEESIGKIATSLKLNTAEHEHLTDLAIMESGQFANERRRAEHGVKERRALSSVAPIPVKLSDADLEWYHFAMEELLHSPAVDCSAEGLVAALNIPLETAAKGMERMLELGWARYDENGFLKPVYLAKEFQTETHQLHRSLCNKMLCATTKRIEDKPGVRGGETWFFYLSDKSQDEQVRSAIAKYLKELARIGSEAKEGTELRMMVLADHLVCSLKS